MSDKTEEWVIKQIQEHGLERFAFLAFCCAILIFAFGYCVGWFLTQRKTRREIEQLKLANQKASGELVKHLAALRTEFISERELLDNSLRNMRDMLRVSTGGSKTAEEFRACREEMCSIYQNRYLSALMTYAESIAAVCEQPDKRIRVKSELVTGLKTMCGFLQMANMPEMLAKCGASPFLLRQESRDVVFERIAASIPWWCFRLRSQLRNLREKTDAHLRK